MMDRRDFLKNALVLAALAPLAKLHAKAGADGDKGSDIVTGSEVTRRRYKNTAMTLPLLGFGCMRLPRLSPDGPEIDAATAAKMIDTAMKAGCNYFDTAYMYHNGLSERFLGEALKKYSRDSDYLAEKMPVWFAKRPGDIERIFNEQLKRCRTEYFDFYLLHSLDENHWSIAQKLGACDFLEKKKIDSFNALQTPAKDGNAPVAAPKVSANKAQYEQKKAQEAAKRKKENQAKKLEKEIEELTAQKNEIELKLAMPEHYAAEIASGELYKQYEQVRSAIEEKEWEWMELVDN